MFSKKLLSGAALSAISIVSGTAAGSVAYAQSTGSQAQEETTVVVTGGRRTINGAIAAETVAKSRATITSEYIEEQTPGQSVLQTINLVPGVNFTNNDPYGTSGGNLRMRGFDGNRISLTFDGVPLNDSGNYAIFSNQQLDSELISRATVNMGTTDVDSPTASATGGTVNYVTRRPADEFGVMGQVSFGDFDYERELLVVDTGQFGPWDTTAFAASSFQAYDKWKGPGELQKQQYNFRLYQNMGDGDFWAVAVHYNRNRNNFYRNITLAQFMSTPGLENDISCTRPVGVAGTVQNENTNSTIVNYDGVTSLSNCTNYHGIRINPSNTGNIRGQLSLGLGESFRFTFDPSFQYVLANGGGYQLVNERDDRLDLNGTNNTAFSGTNGTACPANVLTGVDLNGDGDSCDNIGLYTPSNTNTRRFGYTTSLIWDLNDNNRFRIAYTSDYARHRQTGEMTFLGPNGDPGSVFGGKDGWAQRVQGVTGAGHLNTRNRYSIASLSQLALEYRGYWMDDALTVNIGVRAPVFDRELDQKCYSLNGTSTVRCTAETPSLTLANGNVQFASTTTSQWVAPYQADFQFDDLLPNVGVNYRLSDASTIFFSYAEGLSAPRTDNLYTPLRGATPASLLFPGAVPETTQAIDIGYRYQTANVIASASLWSNQFQNRIVSAFDETLGISVDRNVGDVSMHGLDAQVGFELSDSLTVYASASWITSELKRDIPLSATQRLPTAGKALVETPENTFGWRVDWDPLESLSFGLQGKYVGDRYTTDVNDQTAPAYHVWDLDARLSLGFIGLENSYVQLNVMNLFDEKYIGSISSTNHFQNIIDVDPVTPGNQGRTGLAPFLSIGSPRTTLLTIRHTF